MNNPRIKLLALAVHASLLLAARHAVADDPTAAELTTPRSTVEIGVEEINKSSFDAGRYDGRYRQGPNTIGNVDLYGGGSYDSNDATRWQLHGHDLGYASRDLEAEYGVQGDYRITFDQDHLRRNLSDSYRTPYQGIGTPVLSLPAGWVFPAASNSSAGNFPAGVANSPKLQLNLFQPVDLYTERTRTDLGFSYELGQGWGLDTRYRHDFKQGLRDQSAPLNLPGDRSFDLPDAVNQTTDEFDATVRYTGQVSQWTFGYEGVRFRNGQPSLTFPNALTANNLGLISESPANQFDQLNATGAFNMTGGTHLTVGGSYGRNTQNDAFLPTTTVAGLTYVPLTAAGGLGTAAAIANLPESSLHGFVATTHLFAKLNGHFTPAWGWATNARYDERDNRTPVQSFVFNDVDNYPNTTTAATASKPASTSVNYRSNTPYSKRNEKLGFDTDYRLPFGPVLAFGDDWERVHRYCNGTFTACENTPRTTENTLRGELRTTFHEDTQARLAVAYGDRRTSGYNQDATLWAGAGMNQAAALAAIARLNASGYPVWGPNAAYSATPAVAPGVLFPNNNTFAASTPGLAPFFGRSNAFDITGLEHFDESARKREKLRASVSHELTEKVSLQAGLDYNRDRYPDDLYGLQESRAFALHFDVTYAASEQATANLFFTHEDTAQRINGSTWGTNAAPPAATSPPTQNTFADCNGNPTTLAARAAIAKIDQCFAWQNRQREVADTVGVGSRRTGLMGGRLEVSGDAVFSRARSDSTFPFGGVYANVLSPGFPATATLQVPTYFHATNLPGVTTLTLDLHLQGGYQIDKVSQVKVGYRFGWIRSADYAYQALQPGTNQAYLPTFQQSPAASVQAIGVSYVRQID